MPVNMLVCATCKCSRSNGLLELDVQQVDYAVDEHIHTIDPFALDHVSILQDPELYQIAHIVLLVMAASQPGACSCMYMQSQPKMRV